MGLMELSPNQSPRDPSLHEEVTFYILILGDGVTSVASHPLPEVPHGCLESF